LLDFCYDSLEWISRSVLHQFIPFGVVPESDFMSPQSLYRSLFIYDLIFLLTKKKDVSSRL
jgi:hypothetical protein